MLKKHTNNKDENKCHELVGKVFLSGTEFQMATTLLLALHITSILNAVHMQKQWMKDCFKWIPEKQMTLGESKKSLSNLPCFIRNKSR